MAFKCLLSISILFLSVGCSQNCGSKVVKREYILWEKKTKVVSSRWTKYQISSTEGLKKVDSWVENNKLKLDYPADLSLVPYRILYYKENDEVKKEYIILDWYPESSLPISEREFVEHIPKDEIESLIKIFSDYGTSNELEKGPYP